MAVDVSKQLERAKKFLEKNRVEDAIEAYLACLTGLAGTWRRPRHWEICTRGWSSRTARRSITATCLTC